MVRQTQTVLGFGACSFCPVPHRQFIFSIPTTLCVYFKYERELLTKLCHCAEKSLEMFLRTVLRLDDGIMGLILVIHTFTVKSLDIFTDPVS